MTDDIRFAKELTRRSPEGEASYHEGYAAGMRRGIELGRASARVDIEANVAALPIRTRQGVELIERGATLRIIHDLDSE